MPRIPLDGLQLEEDPTYQRREWVFERAGWGVMGLVISAALLGLLGTGPLNSAKLDPDEGVRFQYERRLHYGTRSDLRFHVSDAHVSNGECHLWLSKEYLDRVHVKEIVPMPTRVEAGQEGHTFVFRFGQGQQSADLLIRIEPEKAGELLGRARLGARSDFEFEQFVYP
jgi:hypothetical protein